MEKPYRHGVEYDFQKEKPNPLLAETEYYSGFVYKDIINKEYLRLNMQENPYHDKLDNQVIAKLNQLYAYLNYSQSEDFSLSKAVLLCEDMFREYLYIEEDLS